MAFPSYVLTRTVSVGGAAILESSDPLRIRLTITASKSLIHAESGYRFKNLSFQTTSEAGTDAVAVLPRTDLPGWKDARTGDIIDVTAEGSYTHQYMALVEYLDADGNSKGIAPDTIGPFVVPAGDGAIDLDKLVPVGSSSGESISFPAYWDELVQQAQASAAAAQAALLDSADFIGSEIARSGSPAEQALLPKIADVAGPLVDAAVATVPRESYGFRWVADGDSITINETTAGGGVTQDHGKGWVPQFAALTFGAVDIVRNAAVAGQTSLDAVSRFDAQVAPYAPDVVMLTIGTNNIGQGRALSEFLTSLDAYLAKCRGSGARLLLGAIWPTSITDRAATTRTWNDALYVWAATNGIDVIPWDRLADPATGYWPTGWTNAPTDLIHPGLLDSFDVIAKFGADFIRPKLGVPSVRRAVSSTDGLLANGLFTATTAGPSAPAFSAVTPSTSAGTLPAGLYSYRATSRTYWGETLPGVAVEATLSGAGQITLTINGPANNRGKRIYRKGPGDANWKLLAKVGPTVPTYVDDGSVAPSGTIVVPTVDSSVLLTGLINGTTSLHDFDTHGPFLRAVAGVRGNVLRISQYEGASAAFLDRFDVPVTAGDVIDVSCLMASSAGGDATLILRLRSAAPAEVATVIAARGQLTQGMRLQHLRFTVPANVVNMRLSFEGAAGASWIDVAEVAVRKIPTV